MLFLTMFNSSITKKIGYPFFYVIFYITKKYIVNGNHIRIGFICESICPCHGNSVLLEDSI